VSVFFISWFFVLGNDKWKELLLNSQIQSVRHSSLRRIRPSRFSTWACCWRQVLLLLRKSNRNREKCRPVTAELVICNVEQSNLLPGLSSFEDRQEWHFLQQPPPPRQEWHFDQQNSRGALDSSMVRAARPAHVGALWHIKTLNSREVFSAWEIRCVAGVRD